MNSKDPIGKAIWDYYTDNDPVDITVESDITDDDIIPIQYLFRSYDQFPALEIEAMKHCKGVILDVGAAAGPHSRYLLKHGFKVDTVEISQVAYNYLKETLPEANHYLSPILNFSEQKYDTILLLMNGIGLAGTYNNVVPFLKHLASLLKPGGIILAESTDVLDIFEDDEGGLWVDLNTEYYGDFRFNMKYKETESGWFNWVYLDRVSMEKFANEAGLDMKILYDKDNSFLIQLQNK